MINDQKSVPSLTNGEADILVAEHKAVAARDKWISLTQLNEVRGQVAPILLIVEPEWTEAIRKIYPRICLMWPSYLGGLRFPKLPATRGLAFAVCGQDEATFLDEGRARKLIGMIDDDFKRNLALDYLEEHDPASEVFFILQEGETKNLGVFRLPRLNPTTAP